MAFRLEPLRSTTHAKIAGPEDAGIALEHAEERKEFGRLVPRDHAGEKRSAQRLRASLHHADQDRQRKELRGRVHEVAEHADERIDDQADEDRRLGPDAIGEHPEQERERDADELRDQQRADHRVVVEADLGSVDGGHPDDRLDAVVVDQEGEQEHEGLPVHAKLLERLEQPPSGHRQARCPTAVRAIRSVAGARAPGETAESRTGPTRPRRSKGSRGPRSRGSASRTSTVGSSSGC